MYYDYLQWMCFGPPTPHVGAKFNMMRLSRYVMPSVDKLIEDHRRFSAAGRRQVVPG
jgi:hypothetical protein